MQLKVEHFEHKISVIKLHFIAQCAPGLDALDPGCRRSPIIFKQQADHMDMDVGPRALQRCLRFCISCCCSDHSAARLIADGLDSRAWAQ